MDQPARARVCAATACWLALGARREAQPLDSKIADSQNNVAKAVVPDPLAVPKRRSARKSDYRNCFAALTVFAINIAIVIGPTPPGTGVIAPAFFDTSSNATSPTSR